MEMFLNLAWLAVAALIIALWLHGGNEDASSTRRRQLVAIAVLLVILFPVISLSDDLLAVQSSSETDNYLRRDHLVPSDTHPAQPVLGIVTAAIFAGIGLGPVRIDSPGSLCILKPVSPDLSCLYNRPPPTA